MKRITLVFFIICLLVFLNGCSEYSKENNGFFAGVPVTPEQMAEISRELATDVTAKAPSTKESTSEDTTDQVPMQNENTTVSEIYETTIPAEPEIVYWTANSSVWHIRRDCSSLSRSTDIKEGSVDDAIKAGLERVCKRCSG